MISLDERARAAAKELRDEADRRDVPGIEELLRRQAPAHRPLVVAAAVVVLVVVGLVVLVGRDDSGSVDVASVPEGVPGRVLPVEWSPGNLGFSVQVPDGWREAGPLSGFAHSMVSGDGAYVLAGLVLDHTDRPLEDFAAARRADIEQSFGAVAGSTAATEIDGHEAVEWSYRLEAPDREEPHGFGAVEVLEHVIDVGDRLRLIVAVGEPTPVDEEDLRRWIGSTIEVGEPAVFAPAVEHPAAADPPPGTTPLSWAPNGLGVALDVPDDWTADVGFDHDLPHARGGGATMPFVLAGRLPAATGSPEARASARQGNSQVEDIAETEVDGRPATVTRYLVRLGPAHAALQVEYVIDLDDGTFAVLTFGYPVTSPSDVNDWVRSTIRLTP